MWMTKINATTIKMIEIMCLSLWNEQIEMCDVIHSTKSGIISMQEWITCIYFVYFSKYNVDSLATPSSAQVHGEDAFVEGSTRKGKKICSNSNNFQSKSANKCSFVDENNTKKSFMQHKPSRRMNYVICRERWNFLFSFVWLLLLLNLWKCAHVSTTVDITMFTAHFHKILLSLRYI